MTCPEADATVTLSTRSDIRAWQNGDACRENFLVADTSMFRDSSLSGQKFVSAAGLGWSKCDAPRALLLARRRVEHDVVT